ncbi:SMP-30/gluconolactonase/LRE family protein [Chitinasiproducens palmae]|uniref:Major royal jelly protein n=1 Tax=Chitinasiproducens palmae TaxID=1770053 RepID=A0A1H2PPY7_9BURK|nr:L-dopachrome tautomerase-related protein [Chitinasiproducens palmae]SDV48875.1 Major royal jelly protein [Chitinasiproducens palmae]
MRSLRTIAVRRVRATAAWTAVAIAGAAGIAGCATSASEIPTLVPVYHGNRVWNGVTTTHDGRTFVSYPQADGPGVQLAELDGDGRAVPYPAASWNTIATDRDLAHRFVHVNAARIGPDDALWVVDAGAPGIGKPVVPGAARLFQIDVSTGKMARVYALADATRPQSYIDDVRFNGRRAYLTDAGAPGLLVLDLDTGAVRRVLDGHPSTIDTRALRADGKVVLDESGTPLRVHADQLEVAPDGTWLYYQPASGPLVRVPTRLLDDATVSPDALAAAVQPWADTPTTGGTAIDAAGNIYLSDTDHRRILKVSPAGETSTLIADPRLIWSDAMWIDASGYLWLPASQQNRTAGFNQGQMTVSYPVWIYKLKIGVQPSPIDHR